MRAAPLVMLALPFVLGCEPEVPTTPAGQVCFPLSAASKAEYGGDCAVQACAPQLVVAPKTSAAADAFICGSDSCSKANESDDVVNYGLYVHITRPDLFIMLHFARGILDQPLTLSSLREHLLDATLGTSNRGIYPAGSDTASGEWVPANLVVTFDDFADGVLTFHADGQQTGLSYVNRNATPHICTGGGPFATICSNAYCYYARANDQAPAIDVHFSGTARLAVIAP